MATTVVNLGDPVGTEGDFTVFGVPQMWIALSDGNAATGITVPGRGYVTLRLRLRKSDIDQIPDGLVGATLATVDAEWTQDTKVIRVVEVVNNRIRVVNKTVPDENSQLFVTIALDRFDFSRPGPQPSGTTDGPSLTGLDAPTLEYGILTIRIDASRVSQPVNIRQVQLSVTTNQRPIVSPNPPVYDGGDRPTISFQFLDPENKLLETFRIYTFLESDAAATGFDPNTATPVHDSGTQVGPRGSYTYDTPLQVNTRYRAYITASEEGSGDRYTPITAAGPYVPFEIRAATGPVPIIRAERQLDPNRYVLELESNLNLVNIANSPTGSGNSIAFDNVQYETGIARAQSPSEKRRTGIASGVKPSFGIEFTPATPGTTYSVACRVGSVAAPVNSDTARIRVEWFKKNELLGTVYGPAISLRNANAVHAPVATGVVAPEGATQLVSYVEFSTAVGRQLWMSSGRVVEAPTLNIVANPLLQLGSPVAENFDVSSNVTATTQIAPYAFGDSARRLVMGAAAGGNGGGAVQFLELPPGGVSYGLAAVVMCSKRCTVTIGHSQIGIAQTQIQANKPTVVQLVGATKAADQASVGVLSVLTDATGANFDINAIIAAPVAPGTDMARVLPELLDEWTPGERERLRTTLGYRIERSNDEGKTWQRVRAANAIAADTTRQKVTITDYEASGDVVMYRARSVSLSDSLTPVSVPSPLSAVTVGFRDASESTANGTYLISLSDASIIVPIHLPLPYDRTRRKRSSVKLPLEGKPVVQYGGLSGWDGQLQLETINDDEYQMILALDEQQETVLLSWFDGDVQYIDLPGDLGEKRTSDITRELTLEYSESEPPPVYEE